MVERKSVNFDQKRTHPCGSGPGVGSWSQRVMVIETTRFNNHPTAHTLTRTHASTTSPKISAWHDEQIRGGNVRNAVVGQRVRRRCDAKSCLSYFFLS